MIGDFTPDSRGSEIRNYGKFILTWVLSGCTINYHQVRFFFFLNKIETDMFDKVSKIFVII